MQLHQVEQHAETSKATYLKPDGLINQGDTVITQEEALTHDPSVVRAELTRHTYKVKRRIVRVLTALALLEAGVIAIKSVTPTAMWEGIRDWSLVPEHMLVSVSLSAGLLLSLFIVMYGSEPRRRRRALVAEVANHTDVRAIGPLIDSLQLGDAQTHEIAIKALIDLLPQVTEADNGGLTHIQRTRLYKVLNTPIENLLHKDIRALFRQADNRAIAFRVAILQALPAMGDEHGLTFVRHLAESIPKTDGERRIRDAANKCMPALQARLDQLHVSRSLLRPSDALPGDKNALLRADTMEFEHDPRELVREGP